MEVGFKGKTKGNFWLKAQDSQTIMGSEFASIGLITEEGLSLSAIISLVSRSLCKSLWVNLPASSAAELLQTLPGSVEEVVVFAGWPTLTERPKWELAFANRIGSNTLSFESRELLKSLNKEPVVLADRVGLYTPRLLAMIINEAWFMVAEGSGTESDIDTAMQLGVNYPKGPFQWGREIGIRAIVSLLKQVQEATGDPRYKVCPLLQEKSEREAI